MRQKQEMTITQLEYLVAVDMHKSFAKAAKRCFVTQPTLSMQIKKVEEELNVLIFDRSKKPVLTTEIGQQIIEQARITIQEAKRINEIVQSQKDDVKGELRIGIIPTLSPYLLPLFVTQFIQKYPEVSLVIQELLSQEIVDKMNNDLLDVGILVTPLNEKSIVEIPLFYESFVVYISTNHPLSAQNKIDFKDLDINEMWLLKEGHCFRSQAVNICGEDQGLNSSNHLRFESGSLETLRRIVEKQFGYTLLPELATMDLGQDRLQYVKTFSKPRPVREVSLVIHRKFMKRRLIELLKTEILDNIPEAIKANKKERIINWKE
ncbi:MAG: LysR substrate-binding domain-containing protein [Bacteroidota bacterium]